MDTTADEPHAFQRLRRSPSSGSGSAPLPTVRAAKRKLSLVTYGPTVTSSQHSNSSPSSPANGCHEAALAGPSRIANAEQNSVDSSAHEPATAKMHTEGRCNGIVSDYDFNTAPEDCRDPRISAACLVVNVAPSSTSTQSRSTVSAPDCQSAASPSIQTADIASCSKITISPTNITSANHVTATKYPDVTSAFSCFYYQTPFPSNVEARQASPENSTSDKDIIHALPSPTHDLGKTSQSMTEVEQNSWRRSVSAQSRTCPLQQSAGPSKSKDISSANVTFQLDPLPPFKRRKVDDTSSTKCSRPGSKGPISSLSSSPCSVAVSKPASLVQPALPTVTERPVHVELPQPTQQISRRPLADALSSQSTIVITSRGREAHLVNANLAPVAPSVPQRRRSSRRRRAQSLPNMRVQATLDVQATAQHRLLLLYTPIALTPDSKGRVSSKAGSRSSASRSSKKLHVGPTLSPNSSKDSQSRSTFTPALQPPVTRQTLRELDLLEILKNPQLRHDVVFDPNVQFRPNFDGERGRRKREAGELYWSAIAREIKFGCTCTAYYHGRLMTCTCKSKDRAASRIPLLVQELRAICLSILPSNFPASSDTSLNQTQEATSTETSVQETDLATTHHDLITKTLDPQSIALDLQRGNLDVPCLITFLGSILRLHCAPMRDQAIEKMVRVVCVDHDIGKGLQLCFEILELMKLDIANHQLRSTRPYLVETAVDFEVRWCKEQVEQGKMSLTRTTAWLQQAFQKIGGPGNGDVTQAFSVGMVRLVFDVPGITSTLPSTPTSASTPSSSSLNNTFASCYPETFQFDAYRMMTFHNDVVDLTIVYMLLLLFRQLCCSPLKDGDTVPATANAIAQSQLKTVKGEIWCLLNEANLCLSSPAKPVTASRQTATDKALSGSSSSFAKLQHPRWREAMQNVLLQIAARASAVQTAASQGLTEPSKMVRFVPSTQTQTMLSAWMQNNLCATSNLHQLCQKRLREVVLTLLDEKLRSDPALRPGPDVRTCKEPPKLVDGKTTSLGLTSASEAVAWTATLRRTGLDPFAAEIQLLSNRISKVAIFHLRVFHRLYAKMDLSVV